MSTDIDLDLGEGDKSKKGFRKLLTILHFLWGYPKNTTILPSTCGTCERLVQGENLWKWVRVLASLKAIKIVWPEVEYNNPNQQIFIVSVDDTDYKVWEK